MKTCIGYILFLYVLLCTVVPCTIIDNCDQEEHTQQNPGKDTKEDCNNCSPFSICSSSHGFTIGTITIAIDPVIPANSPVYSNYYCSSKLEYYFSHFQPPRAG